MLLSHTKQQEICKYLSGTIEFIKVSVGQEIQTPPSGENDNNTQCCQRNGLLKKINQAKQGKEIRENALPSTQLLPNSAHLLIIPATVFEVLYQDDIEQLHATNRRL